MADCCNSFGGRISIEIGGIRYPARGDISISPTNIEVAGEANHDGSAYFTAVRRQHQWHRFEVVN